MHRVNVTFADKTVVSFVLPQQLTPVKPLGCGAFGAVISAVESKTGQKVAIKKITNVVTDKENCPRVFRELRMMHHFNHPNVLDVLGSYGVNRFPMLDDVYLVMDHMDTDLFHIIHSKQKLLVEHVRYFMFNLVKGLVHIHSAGVIHRDIKPSNILINADCSIKIADFGLARSFLVDDPNEQKDHIKKFTEYTVTRWYRAPEVMCCSSQYDEKIDIWSLGCIFGELFGRRVMFKGKDYLEQMEFIIELLGTPSNEDLKMMSKEARVFIESLVKKRRIPLSRIYTMAPPEAIDLLEKMLAFNPAKRISAENAYFHPFFAELREKDPLFDEDGCDELFYETVLNRNNTRRCFAELHKEINPAFAS